jgi:hypothetical protein
MTNNTDTTIVEYETANTQHLDTPIAQSKRKVYPEVSNRLSASVIWLGITFIVIVFVVQHFSGYS